MILRLVNWVIAKIYGHTYECCPYITRNCLKCMLLNCTVTFSNVAQEEYEEEINERN